MQRIGDQTYGSVYKIDTGEWLATVWPTYSIARRAPSDGHGGWWFTKTQYHNATRHADEAAALVAHERQQIAGPSYDALQEAVDGLSRELCRDLYGRDPARWCDLARRYGLVD